MEKLTCVNRSLLAAAVLFASAGLRQEAQAQSSGALVLEAPASTEAMAYGNAPYLYTRESGILFYAPALLGRASGATGAVQRYGSVGTLATLSGTTGALSGRIALGVQYLRYSGDGVPPAVQDSQSVALHSGGTGVSEFVASIGYSRTILGISAGLVIKYIEQAVEASGDRTVAADLGIAKEFGPVIVNLVGRNFGPDLDIAIIDATMEAELPHQVALGVSCEDFEVGPLDVFLTTQVMRRRDGEFIPAGGLEISYWPVEGYTFRVRGGAQRVVDDERSPFTFGAALTVDNITLEYAFQEFDGEGSTHRFGIRWR